MKKNCLIFLLFFLGIIHQFCLSKNKNRTKRNFLRQSVINKEIANRYNEMIKIKCSGSNIFIRRTSNNNRLKNDLRWDQCFLDNCAKQRYKKSEIPKQFITQSTKYKKIWHFENLSYSKHMKTRSAQFDKNKKFIRKGRKN